MNENPLISIVMPAYNVEKYIGNAIESVIKQSYINWELVICNDASSDNTEGVVYSFNDKRIRYIKSSTNSGACFLPREVAFHKSIGDWILNLDADDYIEQDYLLKIVDRLKSVDCDVCCGQMFFIDEDGRYLNFAVPSTDFDFSKIISGIEAYNFTVPNYVIGLNGSCVKRYIWEQALKECPIGCPARVHDDEQQYRIMLLNACKVVFAQCKYYYRMNPDSLTGKCFSKKSFDLKFSNKDFINFICSKFGAESKEHINFLLYDFNCFKNLLRKYCSSLCFTNSKTFFDYYRTFFEWYRRIDFSLIKKCFSIKDKFLYKSFPFFVLYYTLRSKKISHIYFIFKYYIFILIKLTSCFVFKNEFCLWYVLRKKRERKIKNNIKLVYSSKEIQVNNPQNVVLNIYNGNVHSGGLADRFRGIISTYLICKEKGIPYRLLYTDPFSLQDYLVPNLYDWVISESQICYDLKRVNLVILDSTQDSSYQIEKQKKYLKQKIKRGKQNHIYTNTAFSYNENFYEAFYELFKPTDRLQSAIDKQLRIINGEYISVSCRFLDLLGDFNEPFGRNRTLSEYETKNLLNEIKLKIECLHERHNGMKILVNSDSTTFLDYISCLEYVYIIPGVVTHIDNDKQNYSYGRYEKTFLDFFLISKAKHVYLIKNSEMFLSGYPYAASKIGNVPFDIVEL